MGLLKFLLITATAIIAAAFLFGPGLQLRTVKCRRKEKPPFYGPLSVNTRLDYSEKLYEGIIGDGPESLAIINNILYTGVEDGRIQQIDREKITTIANCVTNENCSRPLGMRINIDGDLIVADAYKGIYKVDIESGNITTLVSSSEPIEGKKLGFANDLTTASNGDIYFSDSSYKYNKANWDLDIIECAGNGRLLHYNQKTKNVSVLLDNLQFANGVELSADESFLILAELNAARIIKYHLKGLKQGQAEIFSDNLPGLPDNIRITPRNTFWVTFAFVRLPNETYLYETLSEYPFFRKLIFSTMRFIIYLIHEAALEYPNSIFPVIHDQMLDYYIFRMLVPSSEYGQIIELDLNGEIIRSFHSPKGVVNKISEVVEYEGSLYIASFQNNFIGKVKI